MHCEFDFEDSLINAYTNADCWALSIAIAEIANYPIMLVAEHGNLKNWLHAVNMIDEDLYFDITGIYDSKKLLEVWKERSEVAALSIQPVLDKFSVFGKYCMNPEQRVFLEYFPEIVAKDVLEKLARKAI